MKVKIVKIKFKTRQNAKKRVKVTGSGKLLRNQQNKSHLLEHKSPKRKRNLSGTTEYSKSDTKRLKSMIPGL